MNTLPQKLVFLITCMCLVTLKPDINTVISAGAQENQHCAVLSPSSCPVLCDPMEGSQAPLSMGFSKQEYWSGVAMPSPRGSSQPRDCTCVSCLLHWLAGSLPVMPLGSPFLVISSTYSWLTILPRKASRIHTSFKELVWEILQKDSFPTEHCPKHM